MSLQIRRGGTVIGYESPISELPDKMMRKLGEDFNPYPEGNWKGVGEFLGYTERKLEGIYYTNKANPLEELLQRVKRDKPTVTIGKLLKVFLRVDNKQAYIDTKEYLKAIQQERHLDGLIHLMGIRSWSSDEKTEWCRKLRGATENLAIQEMATLIELTDFDVIWYFRKAIELIISQRCVTADFTQGVQKIFVFPSDFDVLQPLNAHGIWRQVAEKLMPRISAEELDKIEREEGARGSPIKRVVKRWAEKNGPFQQLMDAIPNNSRICASIRKIQSERNHDEIHLVLEKFAQMELYSSTATEVAGMLEHAADQTSHDGYRDFFVQMAAILRLMQNISGEWRDSFLEVCYHYLDLFCVDLK